MMDSIGIFWLEYVHCDVGSLWEFMFKTQMIRCFSKYT